MAGLIQTISGITLSYLIGGIPFALLLGKWKGVDIRTVGSGNIGATNLTRAVGRDWGIACFTLDFLKGLLPVLFLPPAFDAAPAVLPILCAAAAVAGHVFPLYLKFKGGKGVSTTLGALVALSPLPVLLAMAVWLIVFQISKYVSLASLCAAGVLPVAALFTPNDGWTRLAFLALALLIIFRHRGNIAALTKGTERKFTRKES